MRQGSVKDKVGGVRVSCICREDEDGDYYPEINSSPTSTTLSDGTSGQSNVESNYCQGRKHLTKFAVTKVSLLISPYPPLFKKKYFSSYTYILLIYIRKENLPTKSLQTSPTLNLAFDVSLGSKHGNNEDGQQAYTDNQFNADTRIPHHHHFNVQQPPQPDDQGLYFKTKNIIKQNLLPRNYFAILNGMENKNILKCLRLEQKFNHS